jgi:class 3 adenylate cyclase
MFERAGRTVICSVVFIDIVGYSKTPVSQQVAMKTRLNEMIAQAMSGVVESERLILDTGDGAALCFLGDPEDALFAATEVNSAVKLDAGDATQTLRIGINLGPIKVVTDLNGQPNAVGDGINVAQRIMSFAGENEILVSRSFYEVVARLSEGNERLFQYLGIRKDKHIREHQVYAFGLAGSHAAPGAESGADPAALAAHPRNSETEPPATALALPASDLAEAERGLAKRIGPLAGVLVKRAAQSAKGRGDFYQTIAVAIPDGADRADFLAEFSDQIPQVAERGETPSSPPESPITGQTPISAAALAAAESRLANFIGPLAGVLVRQAANEAQSLEDLYARLAVHIANASDRNRFLALAEVKE